MIEYSPSIFITVFNFILPMLFAVLVSYEKLEAGRALMNILFWRFFLRLFSLVIAFFSVYSVVQCDYALRCEIEPCNGIFPPKYQTCYNTQLVDSAECDKPLCWETYLGKQFYFLTLFDFVVQVGQCETTETTSV